MIARRRALLQKKGGLPAEYLRVEYIESTSTQFINTGIKSTKKLTGVYIDCEITTLNGRSYPYIVGAYRGDNYLKTRIYCTSTYKLGYGLNTTDSSHVPFEFALNKRYQIDIGRTIAKMTSPNSVQTDAGYYDASDGTKYDIYLFTRSKTDNSAGEPGNVIGMKVYEFKIFENNAPVFNGVPCIRISDSKPGMYDTVSGTFFTNCASSGDDFKWAIPVEAVKADRVVGLANSNYIATRKSNNQSTNSGFSYVFPVEKGNTYRITAKEPCHIGETNYTSYNRFRIKTTTIDPVSATSSEISGTNIFDNSSATQYSVTILNDTTRFCVATVCYTGSYSTSDVAERACTVELVPS